VPGGPSVLPAGVQAVRGGSRHPAPVCFNGPMASHQKHTATGRHDLEPFWPSRQDHDFDRVCCRATNAPAL
jgi:hypothetical protein